MNTTITGLHRLSGIVIASFLLLHFTNHLFALGGPEWHIAVANLFRHIYRNLVVEVVLLMCVIFQIISGIILVFKKGFFRQPLYVVIQMVSGLYLSFFMIFHVRAVMLGRYALNVNTDFYFAAGLANQYPEKLFFIPYYTLSLISVFAHIACAHYIKRMEMLGKMSASVHTELLRKKYKKEIAGICIAGGVVTFLIMIAISGLLYDI
jgi:succinate dehydrogenase/fumarate reductase cytochrome b subunit